MSTFTAQHTDAVCVFQREGRQLTCQQCGRSLTLPDHVPADLEVTRACPNAVLTVAEQKLPPMATRLYNFAKATAKHIMSGGKICTDEQIEQRLQICRQCPFLIRNAYGEHADACSKCGCPATRQKKWHSKLAWAEQSCPDNPSRWGPING